MAEGRSSRPKVILCVVASLLQAREQSSYKSHQRCIQFSIVICDLTVHTLSGLRSEVIRGGVWFDSIALSDVSQDSLIVTGPPRIKMN